MVSFSCSKTRFEPNKHARSDLFRVGFDFSFYSDPGWTGAQGNDGVQFSQYIDIHGESKWDTITFVSERLLYVALSLVEWTFHVAFSPEVRADSYVLVRPHKRYRNAIHQYVGSQFYRPPCSTNGRFNILEYPLLWYHGLCSIWETLPCY